MNKTSNHSQTLKIIPNELEKTLHEPLLDNKWNLFLERLEQHNIDIHALTERQGESFLHYALWEEQQSMVEHLLEAGVSPHVVSKQGFNGIHLAVSRGNLEMAERFFKQGVDPWSLDFFNRNILHLAVLFGYKQGEPSGFGHTIKWAWDIVGEKYWNHRSKQDKHLLHIAASESNIEMCQVLLESKKADVNVQDEDGQTPLHRAISKRVMNIDLIRLLLNHGADVHLEDREGNSPMKTLQTFMKQNAWVKEIEALFTVNHERKLLEKEISSAHNDLPSSKSGPRVL